MYICRLFNFFFVVDRLLEFHDVKRISSATVHFRIRLFNNPVHERLGRGAGYSSYPFEYEIGAGWQRVSRPIVQLCDAHRTGIAYQIGVVLSRYPTFFVPYEDIVPYRMGYKDLSTFITNLIIPRCRCHSCANVGFFGAMSKF